VFPDGCIDLIFRSRRSPDGTPGEAELFVAGAATRAQLVPVEPGTCFVGDQQIAVNLSSPVRGEPDILVRGPGYLSVAGGVKRGRQRQEHGSVPPHMPPRLGVLPVRPTQGMTGHEPHHLPDDDPLRL